MAELTDEQLTFIHEMRVARLATVDERGEAYIVPICYAIGSGCFYTPIDEKPKRSDRPLKRVRNIHQQRRASLVIDRYSENWDHLAWIMVRGPARVIGPDDSDHSQAVELLRERYEQYQSMNLERAEMIVVETERVTGWGI